MRDAFEQAGLTTREERGYNKPVGHLNLIRYRGYYYDEETGLYWLKSRYYDPEVGRFVNADSVGVLADTQYVVNGLNLYAYCENNPVMGVDSEGDLAWWHKVLIGVAVIATLAVVAAVCVATGGAGACVAVSACVGAIKGAAIGAVTGAAIGAVQGGVQGYIEGGWDGVLQGMAKGAIEGAADGFMTGAIMGGISGAMNPSYCFVAGTKVLTETGHKAIEEIEVGDRVLAYDETTGKQDYKRVVQLFRNKCRRLVTIRTNGEEIECTEGHPFYVDSKGWVRAGELQLTDVLVLSNGDRVSINGLDKRDLEKEITVYNFEVEDYHTYYVTESNVLCHNMCAKAKVHGNSLKTTKKTELYALVDKKTGAIKKIGETTRGTARYTKKFYSNNNVSMKIIDSGTKRSMHYQQNRLLHKFYDAFGRLPELNKGFW